MSYSTSAVGAVFSIQLTIAAAVPLLPASSIYSNMYSPFSVKVCVLPPVTVTFSLSKVTVAITSRFVLLILLYVTVGTAVCLSIQTTLATAVPLLPAGPTNSKSY